MERIVWHSTLLDINLTGASLLSRCREFADEHIPWPGENFRERYTERMICATGADPAIATTNCQGDSGGPMVREVKCVFAF